MSRLVPDRGAGMEAKSSIGNAHPQPHVNGAANPDRWATCFECGQPAGGLWITHWLWYWLGVVPMRGGMHGPRIPTPGSQPALANGWRRAVSHSVDPRGPRGMDIVRVNLHRCAPLRTDCLGAAGTWWWHSLAMMDWLAWLCVGGPPHRTRCSPAIAAPVL